MTGPLGPVLFATSNLAKFAQARILFQAEGLDVEQLEAHSQAYEEPYGLPTTEFLWAGLSDVLRRAGRSRLVFIEDTTVVISGLGGDGRPGQCTKEWFADTRHADLVNTLTCADDWSAFVRSDVALYVPELSAPVFFGAETHGRIVEIVPKLDENPLYPWLGRNDFSSWFQPEGATRVLAQMTYEESVRFDFRHAALRKVAKRTREYDAIAQTVARRFPRSSEAAYNINQLALLPRPGENLFVVIVGPTAAGKTTAGHFLSLHRNFRHIEGGVALQEVASRNGISGKANLEAADALFSQQGHDAVERLLVWPTFSEHGGPLIYTGCRTAAGLRFLQDRVRQAAGDLRIVIVDAPTALRYSRSLERVRSTMVSIEDFNEVTRRDKEFGAMDVASTSGATRIRNSGTLESYLRRLDRIVAAIDREGQSNTERDHEATGRPRVAS